MATDIFGLEGEKLKETSRRRLRFVLVFVFAAAIFGFGVYGFVYGFDAPKNFLSQTAALALQTFHDVADFRNSGRLAAEIDLTSGRTEGLAGISPASDAGPSAAVYAMAGAETAQQDSGGEVAASGEENQKSNSASAEISQGVISASVSKSAAGTALTSLTKTAKNNSSDAVCGFTTLSEPTRELIFNEIAWMGSVPQTGETATQAANNEWIELRNISRDDIDLTGWQILDSSEKFKIVFADGEKLSAGGFYLLERADDDSVPGIKANKIYSGALSNSGMNLRLFGVDCAFVDEVNATSGWLGGDNATKATMERNSGDFGWHTSAAPGGTPKAENSAPLPPVVTAATTTTAAATTTLVATTTPITIANYYNVGVSLQGDGGGTVTSSPPGIFCGVDCTESYKKGTLLALTATPDSNSSFIGWSGPCGAFGAGTSTCSFVVTSTASVIAAFHSLVPVSQPAPPPADISTPTPISSGSIVISEIFYDAVGSDTGKEFVELYNRGTANADLSGWSLRNGSSSLASIGSRAEDKVSINGGGFFLVGFSSYNSSPVADVVRSASLPNTTTTVTFYDAGGNLMDSVVYPASCSGCILSSGQSYEREPLTGNQFVVQSNPNPQNSGN